MAEREHDPDVDAVEFRLSPSRLPLAVALLAVTGAERGPARLVGHRKPSIARDERERRKSKSKSAARSRRRNRGRS